MQVSVLAPAPSQAGDWIAVDSDKTDWDDGGILWDRSWAGQPQRREPWTSWLQKIRHVQQTENVGEDDESDADDRAKGMLDAILQEIEQVLGDVTERFPRSSETEAA